MEIRETQNSCTSEFCNRHARTRTYERFSLDRMAQRFDQLWWEQGQPHLAIDWVMTVLRQTNSFIDRHKPWDRSRSVEPEFVITVVAEALRLAGLLLQPVVPHLSTRLLDRLGIIRSGRINPVPEKLFWMLGKDASPLLSRLV